MELASRRGARAKKPIHEIREFQLHLQREGISLAEWQRRQQCASADATNESLQLARRKLNLNRKGR